MGKICAIYRQRIAANPNFRPATITVRSVALKRLIKTWPGFFPPLEPFFKDLIERRSVRGK